MIGLMVVVISFCGKFRYGEYSFSSIVSRSYS